jgi:hypothetical protein
MRWVPLTVVEVTIRHCLYQNQQERKITEKIDILIEIRIHDNSD